MKQNLTIITLVALLMITGGLLINPKFNVPNTYITGTDLRYILPSIGASLLASLLFIRMTISKLNKDEERAEKFEEMGLVNFYLERHTITDRCAELFKNADIIDITAIRLKTLLDIHEQTLNKLLQSKPVKIRILMPNPDSDSARTIEQLLETKQSIRAGLNNVLEWEKRIKKEQIKGTLEIRYSSKLIASMYQRIDNYVFAGPYMNKTESQDTYTLECRADGHYGKLLTSYFETRFNEASAVLKKRPYVIEFLGMPGAGKTTCVKLIKEKYPDVTVHSNEDVECYAEDTPYTFNLRLLDSLNKEVFSTQNKGLIILDRGIEDARVWLKVHAQLSNITPYEKNRLENELPDLNNNIKQYKILFLQPPEFTKERRKIERRIDEWALTDNVLHKLHDVYKKRRSQNDIYSVIDATKPLLSMQKTVLDLVEKINNIENSRF